MKWWSLPGDEMVVPWGDEMVVPPFSILGIKYSCSYPAVSVDNSTAHPALLSK